MSRTIIGVWKREMQARQGHGIGVKRGHSFSYKCHALSSRSKTNLWCGRYRADLAMSKARRGFFLTRAVPILR